MSLAYLNGKLVPVAQAVIPVYDAGFVLGTTVAEQLRTFGGQLFRLDQHLARLQHSLEIVGVDLGLPLEFRSGFEVGTYINDDWRISLSYDHRSNGDLSAVNPGIETIELRVSRPFGRSR